MNIPGLSTLKTWGMVLLGFALAIVTILFKSEQAARAKEKLAGEVKARKVENKATDAMVEGLKNEEKATGTVINDSDDI